MNRREQERARARRGFVSDLIFAWRARGGGDFLRLMMATLIVTTGVAGAAMVLRVRGISSVKGTQFRESAQMVMVRPDDPDSRELLYWAREHSPFPDRWEPSQVSELSAEMKAVREELWESCLYIPKLRLRSAHSEQGSDLELLDLQKVTLPRVKSMSLDERSQVSVPSVRMVATPGEKLVERWQPLEVSWDGPEIDRLLGKTFEFALGVDPQGNVIFCLALNEVLREPDLQNWLRSHHLKSADDEPEVRWGVVTVDIQAEGDLEVRESSSEEKGGEE